MSESPEPELVIQKTRSRFIADFPDRCTEIAAFASRAAKGDRDRAVRLLHRMTGLAGTLGFMGVSEHAARLEDKMREGIVDPDTLAALMAALRKTFTEELVGASAGGGPIAAARHPMTVLLVEDDAFQRMVVGAYLRRAGHTVVEVPAGDQALAKAREAAPTIVLLDLDLPGLDGHGVCRMLKADPELASIPVVFLSAEQDLESRMIGLALGADDFLIKPIDSQELLLRLHRLRERMQSAEPAPHGVVLSYDAFRTATQRTLQRERAALALVRTTPHSRDAIIDALRQETRRRDIVGEYDRHHLSVLLPNAPAAIARDRLAAIIRPVLDAGAAGVCAGIAASSSAGARTVDDLFEEADAALAVARHRKVAVALQADEQPAAEPGGDDSPLVLIGDDDPDVVRIVDAHLGAAGYRRVVAFDGAKVIEQVDAMRPAVLIVDLMMPRMTGFDVLGRLRDMPERRPKIIVLSARGREEDVTRAFDLGADDYIVKPFNPQELVARVNRLLR
jgi:DNA-binding response OmpR family regulator